MYAEAEGTGYVGDPVASVIGSRNPVGFQISVARETAEPNVEDALPPEELNEETKSEALNPDAESWVPRDTAPLEQKPFKSPSELPDSKRSPEVKDNSSKNVVTGDFAHRLLEEQCRQNQRMQELIKQQQESTLALTLPEPEVPTFNGDPIEYWTFVRAFENLIERKTTSESARLYYLVQYTTGEVRELVKSCLTMNPEEGYREARSLLKQRYGQGYRIATAYVDRLTRVPPIKAEDNAALRRFSILLTGCKNTLREIGYISKAENPDTLKMIVNRLPYGLKLKWRDVADKITEKEGREITIEDLSDFVTTKARVATHAIFGDLSNQTPLSAGGSKEKKRPPPLRPASSFGLQVGTKQEDGDTQKPLNQTQRKCPLCSSNHWLSQCRDFKARSLNDRYKFVRSKGLCVNCLVAGHMASSCPKPGFCRVTGCTGTHSSYLHPRSFGPNTNRSTDKPVSTESSSPNQAINDQEVLNGYVKGRNENDRNQLSATGLAVLPVRVKAPGCDKTVETYAFLDNGSTASFCSEELVRELGLSGRQTTLSLTTMEKEQSKTDCCIVSLEVLDLDEVNLIELPSVFTRKKLPVAAENVATQDDIDRWPHLSGIQLPKVDANVGLLIGSDAPEVLEPKEVRPSSQGGPYATRTVFGWVVNGPLGRVQSSCTSTANFIKADLELNEQFRSDCNREFNDSVYTCEPSLSQNDKRALEIMNETATLMNGHYEIALPWKNDPPGLDNNKVIANIG